MKHDYVNYAEIIKSKVSVPSVVSRYLSNVKVVHNRIPCPIHNGTDRNLLIHNDHFYCFVCNEGGDVIRLVRHIFGCDFKTALERLNTDFRVGLPLGTKPSDAEKLKLKRQYEDRIKQKQVEEEEAERHFQHYLNLLELYNTVCRICEESAPQTPWDDWTDDWCTAMRLRTELKAELQDCAYWP